MTGRSIWQVRAAIALALARTLFCAYRAATQSFVHDEAYSYLQFIDAPWSNFWERFDANNHILYTTLARGLTALAPPNEFVLRLPSVLAGLALMLGVWKLLERVESRALRWTAYLGLALHPLLLDFSIAARGYGMSLSFLVWALHAAGQRRWTRAGYLLGFGIAANFTLAFPALAMLAGVFLLERGIERLRAPALIGAPALWIVAILCARPLQAAQRLHFYVGLTSLRDSIYNLTVDSVRAIGAQRDGLLPAGTWVLWSPYLWIAAAALMLLTALRVRKGLLIPLTLAVSASGLTLAHYWLGNPWPIDRTGLYLILLAGISFPLLADASGGRWLRYTALTAMLVATIQFASQLQTRTFEVWWFNSSAKDAMRRLATEVAGRPPNSVRLSVSVAQQPVLEYYRLRMRISALAPIERKDPSPSLTGYDYYILSPPDPVLENAKRLRVVYSEPLSQLVIVK